MTVSKDVTTTEAEVTDSNPEVVEVVDQEVDHQDLPDEKPVEAIDENDTAELVEPEEDLVDISFDDDDSPPLDPDENVDEEQDDDEQDEAAPTWVKQLREKQKVQVKQIKQLEQQLAKKAEDDQKQQIATTNSQIEAEVIGNKPKLADFEYDEQQFETALVEYTRKQVSQQQLIQSKQQAAIQNQKLVQDKHDNYQAAKAQLKVKDFQASEQVVIDQLPVELQDVIILGTKNSAEMVYALGNNTKVLDRVKKLSPIEFAFEISKLEQKLSVQTSRKPKVKPMSNQPASSVAVSDIQKQLDQAIDDGDFNLARKLRQTL